jgi:pantetheine-phosphate adenylyltransferase
LKICIYPGSFDPVTNGHLDIIQRSVEIVDKLIVAIGDNVLKKASFSLEERIELLDLCLKEYPNVEIGSFSGLLVDYANKKNATLIVRGLRAVSDFESEFQMALMNKHLNPNIETLFMMTNVSYSYLSSSSVKEIARMGGNIEGLVPDCIKDKIAKKFMP